MLVYGKASDVEYIPMGESTCIETMVKFPYILVKVFVPEYIKEPNTKDTKTLMSIRAEKDFSGMLGSVDCMHW